MFPPQPQLSLPTPKYGSFHGCSRPFLRRRLDMGDWASEVTYSTHSIISCTVPLPTLPQKYGSQPSCAHRSRNSCVPKWLFSTTPPQWVLIMAVDVAVDGRARLFRVDNQVVGGGRCGVALRRG